MRLLPAVWRRTILLSFLNYHYFFPRPARKISWGSRSINKSTRERVDAKGLYGKWGLHLMGSCVNGIWGMGLKWFLSLSFRPSFCLPTHLPYIYTWHFQTHPSPPITLKSSIKVLQNSGLLGIKCLNAVNWALYVDTTWLWRILATPRCMKPEQLKIWFKPSPIWKSSICTTCQWLRSHPKALGPWTSNWFPRIRMVNSWFW